MSTNEVSAANEVSVANEVSAANEVNDTTIAFIILGALIMIGYGRMFQLGFKEQRALWTNRGTNIITHDAPVKQMYKIMLVLAFIAGAYLVYYLATNVVTSGTFIGALVFLSFSLIWAYNPFFIPRVVLFMVPVGLSLMLYSIVESGTSDTGIIVALTFLIFHTLIFDFGIWTGII